jgi:hypothetical protein
LFIAIVASDLDVMDGGVDWVPGNGKPDAALSLHKEEDVMGFGRGALLWLIGIPLPIILLLAIFMHH